MKMNKRRGLGKGLGTGYYNLVPLDKHIHSLSAKGVKSWEILGRGTMFIKPSKEVYITEKEKNKWDVWVRTPNDKFAEDTTIGYYDNLKDAKKRAKEFISLNGKYGLNDLQAERLEKLPLFFSDTDFKFGMSDAKEQLRFVTGNLPTSTIKDNEFPELKEKVFSVFKAYPDLITKIETIKPSAVYFIKGSFIGSTKGYGGSEKTIMGITISPHRVAPDRYKEGTSVIVVTLHPNWFAKTKESQWTNYSKVQLADTLAHELTHSKQYSYLTIPQQREMLKGKYTKRPMEKQAFKVGEKEREERPDILYKGLKNVEKHPLNPLYMTTPSYISGKEYEVFNTKWHQQRKADKNITAFMQKLNGKNIYKEHSHSWEESAEMDKEVERLKKQCKAYWDKVRAGKRLNGKWTKEFSKRFKKTTVNLGEGIKSNIRKGRGLKAKGINPNKLYLIKHEIRDDGDEIFFKVVKPLRERVLTPKLEKKYYHKEDGVEYYIQTGNKVLDMIKSGDIQ